MWGELLAQWTLDRVYDRIEERYGAMAAWLATLALGLGIIAGLAAILIAIV